MIQDFKDEFIELYGENNFIIIEKLINFACEASIRYKDYINELDGWECSLDIEKINALNSYYYINLYNEELEAEINLDFSFGVDMQKLSTDFIYLRVTRPEAYSINVGDFLYKDLGLM